MLKGDLIDSLHTYRALVHVLLFNAGGSVVLSDPDLVAAQRHGARINVEKVGDSRVFRLVREDGKQAK